LAVLQERPGRFDTKGGSPVHCVCTAESVLFLNLIPFPNPCPTEMKRRSLPALPLLLLGALTCVPGALSGEILGTVTGSVRDAETGAPLVNTNVYLSSTTIGTNTGPDGRYMLTNIPPGVFQIVASRVGHRVKSEFVHIDRTDTLHTDFALEPVTLQGEEVQVVAHVNREWRRLLKDFRRAFIGDGKNAPECTLLNPEVLDFRKERGTNVLIASTDSVLRIENRSLGYRLYARLGVFDWDVDIDRGKFVLYPRFESLPATDSAEERLWRANRLSSYRGSLKHFLCSLVAGNLEAEGFHVDSGTLAGLQSGISHPLSPGDYTLERVPDQRLWKLEFGTWLRVDYADESSRLKSYIELGSKPAILDAAGNLADPLCIEVVGDWTKYRVADLLPLD